jgi:hypothetical protein
MAIAMAQINETPPALPEEIDPRVQSLVMNCLAKKPNQRPESANSLAIRAEGLLREKRKAGSGPITGQLDELDEKTVAMQLADTAPIPRAPVIWPWLALIGLMVVSVGVVIAAIFFEPSQVVEVEDDPRVRTVYSATPLGNVTLGEEIAVTYYVGDYTEDTNEIQDPEVIEPDPVTEDETPADPDADREGNDGVNDAPAENETVN